MCTATDIILIMMQSMCIYMQINEDILHEIKHFGAEGWVYGYWDFLFMLFIGQ